RFPVDSQWIASMPRFQLSAYLPVAAPGPVLILTFTKCLASGPLCPELFCPVGNIFSGDCCQSPSCLRKVAANSSLADEPVCTALSFPNYPGAMRHSHRPAEEQPRAITDIYVLVKSVCINPISGVRCDHSTAQPEISCVVKESEGLSAALLSGELITGLTQMTGNRGRRKSATLSLNICWQPPARTLARFLKAHSAISLAQEPRFSSETRLPRDSESSESIDTGNESGLYYSYYILYGSAPVPPLAPGLDSFPVAV
ncbi:unnamed protein product, partial [Pleuronectes platessa]